MVLFIIQCSKCNTIIGNQTYSSPNTRPVRLSNGWIGLELDQIDNANVAVVVEKLIQPTEPNDDLYGTAYYLLNCNFCKAQIGMVLMEIESEYTGSIPYQSKVFYLAPDSFKEYQVYNSVLEDAENLNNSAKISINQENGDTSKEVGNCATFSDHELIFSEINRLKIFCTALFKKLNDIQKRQS